LLLRTNAPQLNFPIIITNASVLKMGNCLACNRRQADGLVVESRSFSRRLDPWDKTGMVAFRNSDLREFPKQVEVVAKKVRVLDATGNKITVIPHYIELMVICNRVNLSKNRITEVPRGISALSNLRVLLLDNNRIRTLPRAVFDLPKLERLNLAHNYIMELPRSIRKLKALKYLDVCNNKLVSLPRELGELQNLEELHASNNALARLPVDLAKLERLRLIIAENNMIDNVPSEVMLYCENLQTIALHGNPITLDKLQEAKGYSEFEARRKAKWDKSLAAGVLLGASRFDEGFDRAAVSSPTARQKKVTPFTVSPSPAPSPSGDSSQQLLDKGKQRLSDTGLKNRKKKKKDTDVRGHEVSIDASSSQN
jgi:Leucine-rich repeat (LRR) protein